MRGRLINPFLAKVARYDSVSTAADPDAGGELAGGFDPDFREPYILPSTGKSTRKEYAPQLIPCQVEVGTYEAQQMANTGNDPDGRMILVFHFAILEELGLVDPVSGEALLRPNDRLVSIHRADDESLIQTVNAPDGYFCVESQPQSFGLAGGERNLLLCTYARREKAQGA